MSNFMKLIEPIDLRSNYRLMKLDNLLILWMLFCAAWSVMLAHYAFSLINFGSALVVLSTKLDMINHTRRMELANAEFAEHNRRILGLDGAWEEK